MVDASFLSFAPYTAGLVLCGIAAALPAGSGRLRGPESAHSDSRGHIHGPLLILAVPTFTPTPSPTATRTITPSAQGSGVYANLAEHHHGSYRLQRHSDLVEATLVTTRSPLQHAARQQL